MNAIEQSLPKDKKSVYLFMGLFACLLGFVILKGVILPRFLLMAIGLIASLVVLKKGLLQKETTFYFLVTYLPFSKQITGGFGHFIPGLNLTNILVTLAVIFWIKERNGKGEPAWVSTPLNFPIYLFWLLGLISIFQGASYGLDYLMNSGIRYFQTWLIPLFFYFLVVNTVRDKKQIKQAVFLMMIATTLIGLMAIHEYSSTDNRVGGVFDEPNYLGAFFNYYMFLPLGFFLLNWRRPRYWAFLAPFLICFRGIMVTFSRAGYLAFVASFYAISIFRSKLFLFLLLFATLFIFLNPALLPEGVRYRIAQTIEKHPTHKQNVVWGSETLEPSASSRIKLWDAAFKMIQEHPLLGVGYHLFNVKALHYWDAPQSYNPHNTYIHIAVEMGIPALIIFLWILWRIFWNIRGLYKSTSDPFVKAFSLGLLGGFFGLLVSNLYGARFNSGEISSYFWILAAFVMRLRMIEKESST